jgi:hypothetical protein
MPINREQFDSMGAEEEATTSELIVAFLYENRTQAFTRSELATGIDRDPNTVATNLSRLKKRGLVQHRGQYWAITNDIDRLADAGQFSDALARLDEQFGSLVDSEADARAWTDAQPDRPHPSERDDTDSEADADAVNENEPDD